VIVLHCRVHLDFLSAWKSNGLSKISYKLFQSLFMLRPRRESHRRSNRAEDELLFFQEFTGSVVRTAGPHVERHSNTLACTTATIQVHSIYGERIDLEGVDYDLLQRTIRELASIRANNENSQSEKQVSGASGKVLERADCVLFESTIPELTFNKQSTQRRSRLQDQITRVIFELRTLQALCIYLPQSSGDILLWG
jgi:hypothetical protein